ncbi:hypothetical protein [Cryobacterium sp. SO1]|uniref:hypothetical protein n=1 Tax=Cryobacterium sp. SO1 TaxID=1897061 RepID=UPI001022F960|nr:hypothetical protein [Cryobacterium sp. SO1]RZI36846.1 hypothetical protein BJQ95_00725 [Cryobacterium sp. SO1]
MPINLKLSDARPQDVDQDPMSRDWIGWNPALDDQKNYEQNRGIWFIGRRVHKEALATFSHNGRVVIVVALDRDDPIKEIASLDGESSKFAINGTVLAKGNSDYDALFGSPVDGHRNPVTYAPDPSAGPKMCACGCGGNIAGNRLFLPGHDQRAIHDRIAREWGTTLRFIEWFDETFGARDAE